jgi:hypothetical protein
MGMTDLDSLAQAAHRPAPGRRVASGRYGDVGIVIALLVLCGAATAVVSAIAGAVALSEVYGNAGRGGNSVMLTEAAGKLFASAVGFGFGLLQIGVAVMVRLLRDVASR